MSNKLLSERAQRVFRKFDSDGSGYIDREEVTTALKADGFAPIRGHIKALLSHADTNKDGKVSFNEFRKIYKILNLMEMEELCEVLKSGKAHTGLAYSPSDVRQHRSTMKHKELLDRARAAATSNTAPTHYSDDDDERIRQMTNNTIATDGTHMSSHATQNLTNGEGVNGRVRKRHAGSGRGEEGRIRTVLSNDDSGILSNDNHEAFVSAEDTQKEVILTKPQAMASGAMTGVVSKTVTNPLGRLVIMQQVAAMNAVQGVPSKGTFSMLRDIVETQGVKGLWRGNGSNIIKVVPAASISWGSYEFFKQSFLPAGTNIKDAGALTQAAAGGCSGALSVSVIYPLDLIRTRISASSNAQVGWGDTARGIYRAEGVSGFYRGLNVALSGIVPGLAMNWAIYEQLKKKVASLVDEPGIGTVLLSASFASCVSSTFTYPISLTQRTMQMQGASDVKKGPLQIARELYSQNGVRAFYRGLFPFYMKAIPQTAISFACFESLKTCIGAYRNEQQDDM